MRLLSIFTLCFIALNVSAANLFLKGGVGFARSKIDKAEFNASDLDIPSYDFGFSIKGGIGLQVNKYISVETGSLNHDVDLDELVGNETFTTKGSYVLLNLMYPYSEDYTFVLQVGELDWQVRVDPGWFNGDRKKAGKDNFYGVGLLFYPNSEISIAIDFQGYYFDVVKVNTININLIYHFWQF